MIDKEIIKKNFSRYADVYDRYSIIQNFCAGRLITKVKADGFKKILDVGCGTGNYTRLLKDKFPIAQIKAVDISSEMIKIAKKKLQGEGIEFIVADAEEVDFKEQFDMVSSNVSFQWFENLESALAKYKGLLTKDGLVLFSTFGPRTFCELHKSLEEFSGQSSRISACNFIEKSKIKCILKVLFRESQVKEKIYKEECSSLSELLKKIKYTGIRGKGLIKRGFWTHNTVSAIESIYMRMFKGIVATYQVFFCRGIK